MEILRIELNTIRASSSSVDVNVYNISKHCSSSSVISSHLSSCLAISTSIIPWIFSGTEDNLKSRDPVISEICLKRWYGYFEQHCLSVVRELLPINFRNSWNFLLYKSCAELKQ